MEVGDGSRYPMIQMRWRNRHAEVEMPEDPVRFRLHGKVG